MADPQRGRAGEDDDEERPERPERRPRLEDGPELRRLLQMLAGRRMPERARGTTNEQLVAGLKESGLLSDDAVARAMLLVPRRAFVPAPYHDEAYTDAPIRVEEEGFNISAPHMHASFLEALRLRPGDTVLDIGCGCGFIAAAAALLVGPSGRVAGVDVRPYCVELSEDNWQRLRDSSPEYARGSTPSVVFEEHNVFLPSRRYRGTFNKICVGAACPEERIHLLLGLLSDEPGSLLVAPVECELLLYERHRNGELRRSSISTVRFSELEVPSDATVALAEMDDAASARLAVAVSPSAYATEMAWVAGGGPAAAAGARGAGSPAGDAEASSSGCSDDGRQRLNNQADGGAKASGGGGINPAAGWDRACAVLGAPDYTLQGAGWAVKAHREVLQARCPHFRARLTSGMRDADGDTSRVPEAFTRQAVEALVSYLYTDAPPSGLTPPQLADLLHAGCFYGATRLTEECEAQLVEALVQLDPPQAAAEAPALLRLGGELGLSQLQRAAAAFIARHYEAASKSEAYAALSRSEVDLVAAEAAAAVQQVERILRGLQPPEGAPSLSAPQRQHVMWL